tara:strand:+ start:435 stop:560 length:126 start_codon:yes stop_codon:yes gene_type:complete
LIITINKMKNTNKITDEPGFEALLIFVIISVTVFATAYLIN